jgi:glutamyl-tRNA synthetase
MASLDIASKGTPSLVYPSSIIASFLQQSNSHSDLSKNFKDGANVNGSAATELRLPDGGRFNDAAALEHLLKLATDACGFPMFCTVR